MSFTHSRLLVTVLYITIGILGHNFSNNNNNNNKYFGASNFLTMMI